MIISLKVHCADGRFRQSIMGWDRPYKYDMTWSNKQLVAFSSEYENEHEYEYIWMTTVSID